MMRTLCTVIVFAFIVIMATVLANVHFLLGITFFVTSSWMFIENGIVYVPANPPHKAILVILGKRQKVVLSEGLNWLPLRPFIFDLILIKVEKVNYDLELKDIRTPDNALLDIKASITWIAGIENIPESYIIYLNSGGLEGVKKILHNIIEDRVKTWARSNKEGPSNWMEAQVFEDDTYETLVKNLWGRILPSITSEIPVSTWMRFLNIPKSEPTAYDANPKNGWAYKNVENEWNWNGLQSYYDGLSQKERDEINDTIRIRRDTIKKIREGRAKLSNESLGITLIRFAINKVKVRGNVARVADFAEKERLQKEADKVEIDNISERAKELKADHPGLTSEQALETIQVEKGKVSKSVIKVDGAKTSLGSDMLGFVGVLKDGIKEFFASGIDTQKGSEDKNDIRGSEGKKTKKKRRKAEDMTEAELEEELNRFLDD